METMFIAKILLGLMADLLVLLFVGFLLHRCKRWHMNKGETGISDEDLKQLSKKIRLLPMLLLVVMGIFVHLPIPAKISSLVISRLVWVFFFSTGFACFAAGEEKCREDGKTDGYLYFAYGIALLMMGTLFLFVSL